MHGSLEWLPGSVRCPDPGHDDRRPSASVAVDDEGREFFYCHRDGCFFDEDGNPTNPNRREPDGPPPQPIPGEWQARLCEAVCCNDAPVVRWARARRIDPNALTANGCGLADDGRLAIPVRQRNGAPAYVLRRLPGHNADYVPKSKAAPDTEPVAAVFERPGADMWVVTEGEPDALLVWTAGYNAVGACGAHKLAAALRFVPSDARVVVWPDFDRPGLRAALDVAKTPRGARAKYAGTGDAKDACELAVAQGLEAVGEAVDSACPWWQFALSGQGRAEWRDIYRDALLPWLGALPLERRKDAVTKVAGVCNLDPADVNRAANRAAKRLQAQARIERALADGGVQAPADPTDRQVWAAREIAAAAHEALSAGESAPCIGPGGGLCFVDCEHGTFNPADPDHIIAWWLERGVRPFYVRGTGDDAVPTTWRASTPTDRSRVGYYLRQRLPVVKALNTARRPAADGADPREPWDADRGVVTVKSAPVLDGPPYGDPRELARMAMQRLREWLATVPFASGADFANAIAAAVTLYAGRALPQSPLFLIVAPQQGCGKTTLARALLAAGLGRSDAPNVDWPGDETELQKRIFAELSKGTDAVLFDNLTRIKSPTLSMLLTGATWTARVLGRSEMREFDVSKVRWLATGNDIVLDADAQSRALVIDLEPRAADAAAAFAGRYDRAPDAQLRDGGRMRHVQSALRWLWWAWVRAGRPRWHARTCRYHEWAAAVGGILELAGLADVFLVPRRSRYATNEADEWAEFYSVWWATFGDRPVSTTALAGLDDAEPPDADARRALGQAAQQLTSARDVVRGLGHALSRQRGRRVALPDGSEVRIERKRNKRGTAWQLVPVRPEPPGGIGGIATRNATPNATPEMATATGFSRDGGIGGIVSQPYAREDDNGATHDVTVGRGGDRMPPMPPDGGNADGNADSGVASWVAFQLEMPPVAGGGPTGGRALASGLGADGGVDLLDDCEGGRPALPDWDFGDDSDAGG